MSKIYLYIIYIYNIYRERKIWKSGYITDSKTSPPKGCCSKTKKRIRERQQPFGGDVLLSVIYPLFQIFLTGCYGCSSSLRASISGEQMEASKKLEGKQLDGYSSSLTHQHSLNYSHSQSTEAGHSNETLRRRKLTT